jgi:hypothetical protein
MVYEGYYNNTVIASLGYTEPISPNWVKEGETLVVNTSVDKK